MSTLSIRNLSKSFGAVKVLHDIDLDIPDNAFVVFVGPSGCGKSTLLRSIAGLEDVDAGEILVDGQDVSGAAPVDRDFAMVFQTYALYPQMTVRENIGFAMSVAKADKTQIRTRVDAVAGQLRLGDYLDRKPADLSGGQRQRVAIGRAILRDPKVFLFDEPLSNLDAELRVDMRLQIAELRRQLSATFIYVTHDQIEAMTLADQIVVLRDGRIEQVGAPMELYHRPANLFVAGFIGSPKMNVLELRGGHLSDGTKIAGMDGNGWIGIRPEHLAPTPDGVLRGKIKAIENLGPVSHGHMVFGDTRLTVQLPPTHGMALDDTVALAWQEDHLHRFDGDGNRL